MVPLLRSISAGTVSGWVLVGVVLLALVKAWPALKRLQMEEDGSLRGDLLKRITALETAMAEERRVCLEQIAEIRRDYEGRLAAQARQIDALQREQFNLRAAALGFVETNGAKPGIDELARRLDGEAK